MNVNSKTIGTLIAFFRTVFYLVLRATFLIKNPNTDSFSGHFVDVDADDDELPVSLRNDDNSRDEVSSSIRFYGKDQIK